MQEGVWKPSVLRPQAFLIIAVAGFQMLPPSGKLIPICSNQIARKSTRTGRCQGRVFWGGSPKSNSEFTPENNDWRGAVCVMPGIDTSKRVRKLT